MARFALQSPPDARFRQVTLPKDGIGRNRHGEALAASWGQSGESVAASAKPQASRAK
jgi:hypothetical protein